MADSKYGAYADRATAFPAPVINDVYTSLAADGSLVRSVHDGAAWRVRFAMNTIVPPATTAWLATVANPAPPASQTTWTEADGYGKMSVDNLFVANQVRMVDWPASTPRWAEWGFAGGLWSNGGAHQAWHLVAGLRDSSVGTTPGFRQTYVEAGFNGANDVFQLHNWDDGASGTVVHITSQFRHRNMWEGDAFWIRVEDDGTNYQWYVSGTRGVWAEPWAVVSRASYLSGGATQLCYGLRHSSGTGSAGLIVTAGRWMHLDWGT